MKLNGIADITKGIDRWIYILDHICDDLDGVSFSLTYLGGGNNYCCRFISHGYGYMSSSTAYRLFRT